MNYFTPAFPEFFRELSENNTTEWFNANRKRYEKEVKATFAAFVAEMIDRIKQHEPEIEIKPADAIMRINKDIRFSKDKTPYSTHVAANISVYGKKDKSYPGFYFQLSHDKIALVGGTYMAEPAQLHSIRTHIAQNHEAFKAAYSDPQFQQKFGQIEGEKNKRLPEEFQQVVAQEPLIANKQFYYSADLAPALITEPDLADRLMEYYLAGQKVNQFLIKSLQN